MAVAFVKVTTLAGTSPVSGAVTATAGNHLTCFIADNDNANVTSVADTGGNSWVFKQRQATAVGSTDVTVEVWIAENCVSPGTITVTPGGASGTNVHVIESSGLATSSSLDISIGAQAPSGTSADTGTSGTTAQAAEMAYAFFAIPNNPAVTRSTAGTVGTWVNQTGVTTFTNINSYLSYQILSATAAQRYVATFASNRHAQMLVTFKGLVVVTARRAPPRPVLQAVNRSSVI